MEKIIYSGYGNSSDSGDTCFDRENIRGTIIRSYNCKICAEKCGARSDNADSIIWIKELDDSSAGFLSYILPVEYCFRRWQLCSLVQLVCLSPLQFRIVLENVVENRLQKKYFRNIRKAKKLSEYQKQNTFFTCFITRIVGFLPGDIVSLYFGACDVNYLIYLVAGISGSLLSIVTTTLLGEKLNNPLLNRICFSSFL